MFRESHVEFYRQKQGCKADEASQGLPAVRSRDGAMGQKSARQAALFRSLGLS